MDIIQISILFSAMLCSLVAGLVFAFAIVVMPGIKRLGDREYLQAFEVMDGVIQNNQPIFMLVWVGSAVVLLLSTALGIWQLEGVDRLLLLVACAGYFLGVQLPTVTINIPLNNQLQSHDLDAMSESALYEARRVFEAKWVRWNAIRTVVATSTTVLLMVLLVRP